MNKRFLISLVVSASMLAACSVSPKYHYVEPVPTMRLTLLPHDTLAVGKAVEVDGKITNEKTLSLLKDDAFEVKHTRKIHLLVIDPSLTDYQHIHPEPTATSGVFGFKFTPKKEGYYRVWADVTPVSTHKQEFVVADLGQRKAATIDKTESSAATVDGYHFVLTFDKPLVEGNESMGTIKITDAKGGSVSSLQPLMGAFGHMVGFYDDFHTILHTHPLGDEPKSDKERGGPELSFHLMPAKAGFIKLFAQVKINNKELYVPFGVIVKAAN